MPETEGFRCGRCHNLYPAIEFIRGGHERGLCKQCSTSKREHNRSERARLKACADTNTKYCLRCRRRQPRTDFERNGVERANCNICAEKVRLYRVKQSSKLKPCSDEPLKRCLHCYKWCPWADFHLYGAISTYCKSCATLDPRLSHPNVDNDSKRCRNCFKVLPDCEFKPGNKRCNDCAEYFSEYLAAQRRRAKFLLDADTMEQCSSCKKLHPGRDFVRRGLAHQSCNTCYEKKRELRRTRSSTVTTGSSPTASISPLAQTKSGSPFQVVTKPSPTTPGVLRDTKRSYSVSARLPPAFAIARPRRPLFQLSGLSRSGPRKFSGLASLLVSACLKMKSV